MTGKPGVSFRGKLCKRKNAGCGTVPFGSSGPPLLLHPHPRNDKRAAPPAFPAPHTTRLQSRLSQTNAVTAAAMAGTCTVSVIPPPLMATYLSRVGSKCNVIFIVHVASKLVTVLIWS